MKVNQLRSGVILSYINLGISTLIPFIYTPIMLRMLGQAEYGLYSLSSSAVAYLSLLSFGFGSTIIRYIAKYRAENNKEAEEKTYGFFLLLYCVLSVLVMGCGIIISQNVEPIFHKGLNINELANAIKPVAIPGEEMIVQVVKEGKEHSQGIAYLDDGTMIVVDGGKKHMGETIRVLVTSVLQTPAGRMIFGKPKN